MGRLILQKMEFARRGKWKKMVNFSKVRICKEQKMQEKTRLNLQGKKITKKRTCKKWILQEIKFASKPSYKQKLHFPHC